MNKKILIIEDDVFLGDTLTQKMIKEGFDTVLARDGAEGFGRIKTFHPDLILLDIILPSMNGYEILEEKLKDSSISSIPVIIISNSGQPVEITRALALGVKDYIIKAEFEPEEVLVKVRAQLRKEDGSWDHASPRRSSGDFSLAYKKIIWVEDDKFLNDIISRKLSVVECTFLHSSNGEEALKMIEKEIPDVVILDIILPGIDGFDVLERIKANPITKNIPVIMLSNLNLADNEIRSKKLGADRFLIKATLTLDAILDQIREVLLQKS